MPGHIQPRLDTAHGKGEAPVRIRMQRLSKTPSALRVVTGRSALFVTSSLLWAGMAFVVASRIRPVALATKVSVSTCQGTKGHK